MKNLSFRNIAVASLVLLTAISCTAQKPMFSFYQTEHWVFPFGDSFEKALYKTTIDVKDHHMTGLLLAKKTSDTTTRIVYSNEVGLRFFDIELNGEKTTVNYMFPAMDKKVLVSILQDDLKMIFVEDRTVTDFSRETKDEIVLYTTKSDRGTMNYTVEKEKLFIRKISTSVKKVKKTFINLDYDKGNLPSLIQVENPFIDMKMQMKLLSNE